MEFKDWHLAVLEDYGYGDTDTALINRVAHNLSKSKSDVIDIDEFIRAAKLTTNCPSSLIFPGSGGEIGIFQDKEVFEKLLSMLDDIEDVQNVYHNVEL